MKNTFLPFDICEVFFKDFLIFIFVKVKVTVKVTKLYFTLSDKKHFSALWYVWSVFQIDFLIYIFKVTGKVNIFFHSIFGTKLGNSLTVEWRSWFHVVEAENDCRTIIHIRFLH